MQSSASSSPRSPSRSSRSRGTAPKKTILVTLGTDVSLFSDVSGYNFIDLAGPKAPAQLRDRLRSVLGESGGSWSAPLAGDFQTCLRRRWKYYDELQDLEEQLADVVVRTRKKLTLLDVVRAVARAEPKARWDQRATRAFMKALKANSPERPDVDLNEAYWWLVVFGFYRFQNITYWWDSERWDGSVDHVRFSQRGLLLLKKLQVIASAGTPAEEDE